MNAHYQPVDDGYQIIDWEFSHIGDPREDLGYYMNYGIAFPPSLYSPDPEAFLGKYRELTGYSELHVNQATVGYFATVAAVHIFAGPPIIFRTVKCPHLVPACQIGQHRPPQPAGGAQDRNFHFAILLL